MHPDQIIAGLRAELERTPKARHPEILHEIALLEKQPKPVTLPEAPDLVVDQNLVYLDGLRDELERAPERKGEIEKEIARVEKELGKQPVVVPDEPAVEPDPIPADADDADEQAGDADPEAELVEEHKPKRGRPPGKPKADDA